MTVTTTGRVRADSLPFAPVLARPLPSTVTPFPNETVDSYFDRLGAMNQTPGYRLRYPSDWLHCPLNDLELLEVLSGFPRTTLVWALPGLRRHAPEINTPPAPTGWDTGFVCRRCALQRSGIPHRVQVHAPGRRAPLCITHRLWTGLIPVPSEQIDLSITPEIVRAQIRLNRLSRRHPAPFLERVRDLCGGTMVQIERRGLIRNEVTWEALFEASKLPDARRPRSPFDPFRMAARYPQTVRLTAMVIARVNRHLADPNADSKKTIAEEFVEQFPLDRNPRTTTGPWLNRFLVDLLNSCTAAASPPPHASQANHS
ncbi:hypothetical protein ACFVGM_29290 [Kitasatospora purpeofusca]|uniref:hypothetical protein n=1 Tax=Kitasatospora purpeofusca TaxID=67352 RepID=UPI0036AC72AF